MKLLVFALLALALPANLVAQGGLPSQPYIYVEGQATTEKPADMVNLLFRVVARNADAAKANQEVQAKAAAILTMLDERKIATKDVIAEDLISEPQYDDEDQPSRGRGKIIGYSVMRSLEARVRDVTIFAKLVDDLIALGGVEFAEIDGALSEKSRIEDVTREKALANARDQAERALKPAGMKIDSVFAISPVAFPEISQKLLGGRPDYYASATTDRIVTPDPLRYRLAPVSIRQSIHVIYLVSPGK